MEQYADALDIPGKGQSIPNTQEALTDGNIHTEYEEILLSTEQYADFQ